MTDAKLHERRLCRVYIRAEDLAKGPLVLPHGAQILRIMPATDMFSDSWEFDHVVILRHEDLPEVPKSCSVPVRNIEVEHKVRDMGPYTKQTQLEARFV